jgi:hypothetical protein
MTVESNRAVRKGTSVNGGESEHDLVDHLAALLTQIQTTWRQTRIHRSDHASPETRLACWKTLAMRLHDAALRDWELARPPAAEVATPDRADPHTTCRSARAATPVAPATQK